MANVSVVVTGGNTTYFYGPNDDIDRSFARDSDVTLSGGTYSDKSPLHIPTKLTIMEGTTLRIEE